MRNKLLGVPLPQRAGVPFRLNKESPQARGLVGWWPMSGATSIGIIPDYIKNNHMSPVNSPVLVGSNMGRGANFTAASIQYLSTTTTIASRPYSYAAWFYLTSLHNGTIIAQSSEDDNAFHGAWLNARSSGELWAQEYGGSNQRAESVTTMAAGNWYHGVAVFESATARHVYLNGEFEATQTSSTTPTSLDNTTIGSIYYWKGSANGTDTPFNGTIIDARIYNYALSAADIRALYNPATRWELYEPIIPHYAVRAPAAAPAGSMLIHPGMQGNMRSLTGGMNG